MAADRIGSQLKLVRDNLEILKALPPIQSAEIADNPRLNALLAAMLKNNGQLFNLYVGYEDGSFIEMDALEGAGREARARLEAPDQAAFRLVVISRSDPARYQNSRRLFLSDRAGNGQGVARASDYDPRQRPWYKDADRRDGTWLTGPYVFFATGKQGYTVQPPLEQGKGGVVAGRPAAGCDAGTAETGATDAIRRRFPVRRRRSHSGPSPDDGIAWARGVGHHSSSCAKATWRACWRQSAPGARAEIAQQFFSDPAGRRYAAAFQTIPRSGPANLRVAVVAPVDEFFAGILSERGRLFAATLAFVAAMVPIVFFMGSLLSQIAAGAGRRDRPDPEVRAFDRPPVRSMIREIDDLGHSVSTMRTVTEAFSRFVPRRLVERLIETGTPLQLGGTRREVTLLFSDIANFTEITEKAEPSLVMQHTSRYFAAMSHEIMSHSGTVDKYIGDAIMAIWNAPADDPDHAVNACAARARLSARQ